MALFIDQQNRTVAASSTQMVRASQTTYRYRPLRFPDSLRLLVVTPRKDQDSVFDYRLRTSRLSQKDLEFEAISYTWGNPDDKRCIQISDSGTVEVTKNCFDLLLNLQRNWKGKHSLWIDAICINQADLDERSSQVKVMGQIYSAASKVIVYVGEQTTGSELLYQELARAAQEPRNEDGHVIRQPLSGDILQEMANFLARPWFHRIWTIQEYYFSRDCDIACGRELVSWDLFHDCLFGYRNTLVTPEIPPWVIYAKSLNGDPGRSPADNLLRVIFSARSPLASDPLDYIFALLPMVRDPEGVFANTIDYTKSAEALFTEFTILLLREMGLGVLTANRATHHRAMSSWCIDWSQRAMLNTTYTYAEPAARHEIEKSLSLDASVIGRSVLPSLRVHGWIVSHVTELCVAFEGECSDLEDAICLWAAEAPEIHFQATPIPSHTPSPPSPISTAIWALLLRLTYYQLFEVFARSVNVTGNRGADSVRAAFRSWSNGTRLFSAADEIVGSAPKETELGDAIVVLQGGYGICILREALGRGWTMISGDAVAHYVPRPSGRPFTTSAELSSYRDSGARYTNEHHDVWGPRQEFVLV